MRYKFFSKLSIKIVFLLSLLIVACNSPKTGNSAQKAILLSQEYLEKCKKDLKTSEERKSLEIYDYEKLKSELNSDLKKTTFWINIYNASTQYFLAQKANQKLEKEQFFNQKMIILAGENFSLNEIENHILRLKSSKIKVFKELKVNKLDPRIHFALNCGAKSCPPVLFYEVNKLDAQLDMSTEAYLKTECEFKNDTLFLPMIFSWFEEDFGGDEGVFEFLRKYKVIQSEGNPKIAYLEYNWELNLGKYD